MRGMERMMESTVRRSVGTAMGSTVLMSSGSVVMCASDGTMASVSRSPRPKPILSSSISAPVAALPKNPGSKKPRRTTWVLKSLTDVSKQMLFIVRLSFFFSFFKF